MSRRNIFAATRYNPPAQGYRGKIVLLRSEESQGKKDPLVDHLRRVARGGVEVTYTPGNHMTMMLLTELRKTLSTKINGHLPPG